MEPVIIGNATLYNADCIEVMATMPDNSLDSIICDPPYLINFMGRAFDSQHKALPGANEGQKMQEWHRRWVTEAYRILKPGGHLAAFGGDRTHHRLMSAMEDVGFELRFNCYWIFSSGFPKSQDASKAIDQYFGMKNQREVIGRYTRPDGSAPRISLNKPTINTATPRVAGTQQEANITEPAHPLAKQWTGYGTATKPAVEICCVGRKPMIGTLAENLLTWGTGAMNLDACRVGTEVITSNGEASLSLQKKCLEHGIRKYEKGLPGANIQPSTHIGRFPPHLLLDGSDVVKKCFPDSGNGNLGATYCYSGKEYNNRKTSMFNGDKPQAPSNYNDSGSASRFFPSLPYDEEDCATLFYCGKASKEDRNQGCSGVIKTTTPSEKTGRNEGSIGLEGDSNNRGQTANPYANGGSVTYNNHVSVKPTALMRWICRLLTPKGGTLLDPFMGSGSTLKAAVLENFTCIGIEMDPDYFEIAKARVAHVSPETVFAPVAVKRAETKPANFDLFGEVA